MFFLGKLDPMSGFIVVVVLFYLASPGLYIPHGSGVRLENGHSGKVHIFAEEL